MRDILRQSNLDLLREIERLGSILPTAQVPRELSPYHEWVSSSCDSLRVRVLQNLQDLKLNRDEILVDILSSTQEITRGFQLYNEKLISPILRSLPSDRLCLRLLRWLHMNHQQTGSFPAGLTDGEFGVWPAPPFPTIYFMPSLAQRGLLYLPLFFHEFGHLLYACHKQELDDLVSDLQSEIADLLRPASQRNDLHSQTEAERHKTIVETYYAWAQELFCDAVGLSIGGPCFARAFSMYLRMTGRGAFHQPPEELTSSPHPVAWLRMRLIGGRARRLSLSPEANVLEAVWETIAGTLRVDEDYYGFYDDKFLPTILQTLDSMLVEVSPYQFTDRDISSSEWGPRSSSPIHLLNRAWSIFLNDPGDYPAWEKNAISSFLAVG